MKDYAKIEKVSRALYNYQLNKKNSMPILTFPKALGLLSVLTKISGFMIS